MAPWQLDGHGATVRCSHRAKEITLPCIAGVASSGIRLTILCCATGRAGKTGSKAGQSDQGSPAKMAELTAKVWP